MALGITGEEGFIAQSLAIVVIGGLFSSTLLTLLLVPALYVMVERAKERLRRDRRTTAALRNHRRSEDFTAVRGSCATAEFDIR